ncbi:MAG TPA: PilZ domain-containing protein [Nitrospiraceae bacterium]|nr:PilZ domain-containing protein [Nitrospiraceae bacterium]
MTSAKPSLYMLLVSDHAEEIKLISTTLRGFYPDCRVEAVYSSDEALQWSLRDEWHLILIDDALAPRSGVEILHELKRNSPHAAIILQTDRADSATALHALQQGADFLLFKESPGFVTELLFYTQEALEKRALEIRLEHTFQRHLRLLESLSDLVYELDHEGRFVYVSPTVTSLLGYAPEELAGRHFSMLLPPTQERIARYHMNERRTGTRSAHQLELYVLGKGSGESERVTLMQLTAKGLYDERRRYLGTVGLLRDLSAQREHVSKLKALETRLQEADRELAASRTAALSSQHLQRPLSALLQDSQRLLTTLQGIHFDQHVQQLAAYAAQATEAGHEVWKAVQFSGRRAQVVSLNSILREVLAELSQEQLLLSQTVEQRFAQTLPGVAGDPQNLKELFRILLLYVLRTPAGPPLLLETYTLKLGDSSPAPSAATVSPPLSPYVVMVIRHDTARPVLTVQPSPAQTSATRVSGSDFLRAYDIVGQHGGSLEIGSATGPSPQIIVRLPASPVADQSGQPPHPGSAPAVDPARSTPSSTPVTPSDRRRYGRMRLRVPLELSIGTAAWQGSILDIGLGGMFIVSSQPTPPIGDQPVYLAIRTSVSFLELQGTVRYRSVGSSGDAHVTSFIIEFTPLMPSEAAVLASFIESLRESPSGLTIEGLIPDTTAQPASLLPASPLRRERRWHIRTEWVRPIRLVCSQGNGPASFTGFLINLSRGGACLRMTGLSEAETIRLSSQSPSLQLALLTEDSLSQELPVQIAWTGRQTAFADGRLVGVSFSRLSLEAEESLNQVLADRLISRSESGPGVNADTLGTVLMFLRTRRGKSLVVSHDRFTDQIHEDSPILIVAPGYAQTRADYLGLGSAFGMSGFRILRCDPTHALGLSDGDPRLFTLGGLQDDLDTVTEFARGRWPRARLAVLTSDLSARVSLKRLGQRRGVDLLLLFDPILDLGGTLHDLHHRDLIEECRAGSRFGLINLMGLPLHADDFLDDAIAEGYADVSSVVADIRLLQCHVMLVSTPPAYRTFAEPVAQETAMGQRILELLGDRGAAISLPCSITGEDALSERSREAFYPLIARCKETLSVRVAGVALAHDAERGEIEAQSRHEREQLRLRPRMSQLTQAALWTTYTQYSIVLSEVPSYLQHSNDLYQTIHPSRPNQTMLDVGCGDYGFARLWLLNEFYRSSSRPLADRSRSRYVGVDLQLDSVRSARNAFTSIERQSGMVSGGTPAAPPSAFSRWIVGDAAFLPFGNDLFDSIVCHFVLNFTVNPVVTVRQLYRLLRPHGTLTMSCFTPSTNPASVYRFHLQEARLDGLSGIHRDLLLDLAQLHEAVRTGRLHSFTTQSLTALFSQITADPVRTFPSLGGHVLVATVKKA